MAEGGPPPIHKRSKSSVALSLLRGGGMGDKSLKSDNVSESGSSAAPSGSPIALTSSQNLPTSDQGLAQFPSDTSQTRLSLDSDADPTESRQSLATADKVAPSGLKDNKMSIQDSVKTFKLFEVLRGGDLNAISVALRDSRPSEASGTTVLHLATQCAEPSVVDYVIANATDLDINSRDREGNTALHLAAQLGRSPVVRRLLEQPGINDQFPNRQGQLPIDLARTPEIFQQLQLARSLFLDKKIDEIHNLVAQRDMKALEELLVEPRVESAVDVNALELATDQVTVQSGGTLLHEAARKRDTRLIQVLLMHGADPFRRDRKGKLPQDVTKDDHTRAILKKSPAAVVAQRGIQEKAILGSAHNASNANGAGGQQAPKDGREMKGYLKKWTNYTSGYKLRWFVLEDGVLSYYKHQDDAGSACRGAINMKIARLHMDSQDKTRFEIHGKSSVKYHLKANHVVEAKRWFWSLNNAIQYTKDEAKEEDKRRTRDAETLRQAKVDFLAPEAMDSASSLSKTTSRVMGQSSSMKLDPNASSRTSFQTSALGLDSAMGDDAGSAYDSYEPSLGANDISRMPTGAGTTTLDGDDDEIVDDSSSREVRPANKDAFNITAQSAKLQLDLLAHVSSAVGAEVSNNPEMRVSDPSFVSAWSTFDQAVSNLNALVVDLLNISRDRDAYWQYRLDREADARKMWEDSMARVVKEQEDLQRSIDESEEKRKRTKRALKEALEGGSAPPSRGEIAATTQHVRIEEASAKLELGAGARDSLQQQREQRGNRRKSIIEQFTNLSDSESGDDEEFFDAIDAGQIQVVTPPTSPQIPPPVSITDVAEKELMHEREAKAKELMPSYTGYEEPIRKKLKMEADDRPKISLWSILKSMIGKDMTKMTLPVSFNEPTSLLQRVAEDMEYADLLDIAADRPESTERLVYVAAFAASEYASTIGRVAKPFNRLLGETYEYVRPDKGYRFFIEQVSHHPPIGAAYAESARWDYWGESAVKSKFYGKSFDINPLGTWFLRLRPASGGQPELYTWKKVTSSVVGIITGNPTVDNYGPMEVKNWTTGEVCLLEFKARGWKASSAYQVSGKVIDRNGVTKWSMGGRWNDKIYARHTPGFEVPVDGPGHPNKPDQAFLVWEANPRPPNIPFNLTPFVVTLNAVPDTLRPHLPPTDTRLRPDQRAMEDGAYDLAATEKNRVEEKQRAKRRQREANGEEFIPKWFRKAKSRETGEEYWEKIDGEAEYWAQRARRDWSGCEDIF